MFPRLRRGAWLWPTGRGSVLLNLALVALLILAVLQYTQRREDWFDRTAHAHTPAARQGFLHSDADPDPAATSVHNPYRRQLLGLQPWSPHELEGARDAGAYDELPWPYSAADARAARPLLHGLQLRRESDIAPMPAPAGALHNRGNSGRAQGESDSINMGAVSSQGEAEGAQQPPVLRTALEHVLLENNNFLDCDSPNEDTLSALERAKTSQCRRAIRRAACMYERGFLYPPDIHTTADVETCQEPLSLDDVRSQNQKLREGRSTVDKSNSRGEANGGLSVIMPLPRPVRLAVMIVVHGRAVTSVKQLLAALYQPQHHYLIHVDERSDYLYEMLRTETAGITNVHIAPFRLDSIWGAANLHQVYLKGMEYLLQFEWDYFINLSGADLPLKPIDDLATFLGQYAAQEYSFLKSHGKNHKRFIQKQGFDRTFVQCDHHMYRINTRRLPPSLRIAGGSDWFMVHRTLATFVTGDSQMIRELRRYYDHSLLSAESFFHMAAHNSHFCPKMVTANLRFANWNRKRGCKCQYKHLVDWCGCSPNVFVAKDLRRIKLLPPLPNFFARKFDGRISHTIIHDVLKEVLHVDFAVLRDYYWENVFSFGFPGTDRSAETYFHAFARMGIEFLNAQIKRRECHHDLSLDRLLDVFAVFRMDRFLGYAAVLAVRYKTSTSVVEVLLTPKPQEDVLGQPATTNPSLQEQLVGAAWDPKERIFQRFGGLLTTDDKPKAAQFWREASPVPAIETQWLPPNTEEAKAIKSSSGSTRTLATFEDDKLLSVADAPLLLQSGVTGAWTVKAIETQTHRVVARTAFPIVPVHTSPDPKREVDGPVRSFWTVLGSCLQQPGGLHHLCPSASKHRRHKRSSHGGSGGGGENVFAGCPHVKWSPSFVGASFDLRDVLASAPLA